jgi:hypothetical protein
MRLIITISACDFLSTLFLTTGFPAANSSYCEWQGFAMYFFSRGSWFFTSALACQLYFLIVYEKLLISEKWTHVICWILNIILGCVVFEGARYGIDDDQVGAGWCFPEAKNKQIQHDYENATFLAPVIVCTFLLIIINMSILLQYYIFRSIKKSEKRRSLVLAMLLYPTCMVIAWLPYIITYFFHESIGDDDDDYTSQFALFIEDVFVGWGVLYGSFLAIVFFANSKEARRRWYNMTIRRLLVLFNCDLSSSDDSILDAIIEDSDILDIDTIDSRNLVSGSLSVILSRPSEWPSVRRSHQDNPMRTDDTVVIEIA